MSSGQRQYEAIVFGATGYTGKYTAEHITAALPVDFKWAVAGRSEDKLKRLVEELRSTNADRIQPGIEIAQLEKNDLVSLAKKTKVLITTVGPYHKYGTAVVEACAETGTHYLDVTGETPWVFDIIQKYDTLAKKNGAIMIPQNGIESAPTDLMAWMVVSYIRKALGVGAKEFIQTIYDLRASASGGTLATVLTLFDSYSLSHFAKSGQPWSMCPIQPSSGAYNKPLMEKLTGLRTVSDLGLLTDSIQGPADIPIVHRTYGLLDNGKYYGPGFHMTAYMKARNFLQGLGIHLALTVGMMALILPPVRWLLKKFVYQPGEGPSKEQVRHEYAEWRAIANADVSDPNDPKRVLGRMRWEGSMYQLTGVCLAEAAITIAREKTQAHELGGGILTPATLGAPYLERLQKAGLKTEVKTLP
ncbi:hypothetical protein KC360_g2450 [Hortaea werneckii]|nr:hypothetical protein KC361_g1670 [Hortaea werneckii]KAI6886528.1 hypothetical protein KC325_g2762 [Hortaea werneckii]KAI6996629.1 hypothetical protein KC359_g3414 [Hortaea werneckii]KAI7149599.1 hypothetical protein KC344_g888 [Hortaea werneckii]KAI7177289.1 hypothetical protein KC360_g2450 [Hortaea werneckii]